MKFASAFLLVFLFVNAAFAVASAARYYVPPGQFTASLQIMSLGLSNITGLFGNATGSFNFDESAKTLSNLKLAVDATSLVSSNSDTKSDLSNLLSVGQFQEIRFTASDNVVFTDNKASIKGMLTLHGNSKPITMDATVNNVSKATHNTNAWAGEGGSFGLSLHGSVKRADFGMPDDPDVPNRFGDTFTLQLEMQAIKQ